MAKKRAVSRPRTVKCILCGTSFLTTHSQGKYCSPHCTREGERASWRKYGNRNRQRRRIYCRKHYQLNKEQITARVKAYHLTPAGKQAQHNSDINQRKKNPEMYRLNSSMNRRIHFCLKGNKNRRSWTTLVDYTKNNLMKHLKKTIPKGYTWEDFLSGELHLDHKIPISAFNFSKPEHIDFKI